MDELRESSLLFSLEGLLETERERVQREAREAQRRREEELGRVAEMAERRRQAAQQEREAEQRRQALAQQRERLEQQHIDAIKHGTVERARIEAEARVRLIEVEQARKHELSLSQIREAQRTAHYQGLTWLGMGAFAVAVTAALSAYFCLIEPAHARERQHWESLIGVSAERAKCAEVALAAEQRTTAALGLRVKQLEAAAAAAGPTLRSDPPPPLHGSTRGSFAHPPTLPTPQPVCVDDGDPLNRCLRSSKHG